MGDQRLEKDNTVQESSFDHIVQLISECVVIKAQLQQYLDELGNERQKSRAVAKHTAEVLSALALAQKSGNYAQAMKEAATLHQEVRAGRLDRVTIAMEETIGRFSKVMGDLQHHLMKMNLGASAISIMQVLLVRIDRHIYALPIEAVIEILKVKKSDIYSVDGNDTISLRGHALSVINVARVLGMPGARDHGLTEQKIVVIRDEAKQLGVMVDELLGEESVVFKELPAKLRNLRGLCGASILGDGKVGLIIDAAQLIAMAAGKE